MLFVCFALYLLPARIVIVAELQRRRAARRPPYPKIDRFGAAQRCGAQIIDNSIDPYRIGSRQNRPRPGALKALFAQASRNGSRNCFPVVKRKWVAKW